MTKTTARWIISSFDKTREEILKNHGHNIQEVEKLRALIGFEMTAIIQQKRKKKK